MPKVRLTDSYIRNLTPPEKGYIIHYDDRVAGFGLRHTAKDAKTFVVRYRFHGREPTHKVGAFPAWGTAKALNRARELRHMIDRGIDPEAEKQENRRAPDMADLAAIFIEDHLPNRRPATRRDYRRYIEKDILPEMKHRKVADVTYSDCDALHRKISRRGSRYAANRCIAVLSKMFSLAIKQQWRANNPCKGIEKNQEDKRSRYLSADELGRLSAALAKHGDVQAANIIRLLLLTGARRGEVQAMRWRDVDLDRNRWVKPGSTTKQKTEHRVPLSAAALRLLLELRVEAAPNAEYVFPGRFGEHRVELKGNWAAVCKAAGIEGVRLHDLRHTYASILASSGLGLPVIGALLGHSQPTTTARYTHLYDDPLKQATERVADVVTGKPSAEVIPLRQTDAG